MQARERELRSSHEQAVEYQRLLYEIDPELEHNFKIRRMRASKLAHECDPDIGEMKSKKESSPQRGQRADAYDSRGRSDRRAIQVGVDEFSSTDKQEDHIYGSSLSLGSFGMNSKSMLNRDVDSSSSDAVESPGKQQKASDDVILSDTKSPRSNRTFVISTHHLKSSHLSTPSIPIPTTHRDQSVGSFPINNIVGDDRASPHLAVARPIRADLRGNRLNSNGGELHPDSKIVDPTQTEESWGAGGFGALAATGPSSSRPSRVILQNQLDVEERLIPAEKLVFGSTIVEQNANIDSGNFGTGVLHATVNRAGARRTQGNDSFAPSASLTHSQTSLMSEDSLALDRSTNPTMRRQVEGTVPTLS